jgi:hypothetical protein
VEFVVVDVVDAFTFELAASLIPTAICLEFCSNTLAAFTHVFDICLEISFDCCSVGFHASRVEKTTSFESLMAEIVLSATLLTNLVYALTIASGVQRLVTNPLKASLSILPFIGIYVVAFSIEQSSTVQVQGQSNDTTTTMKAIQANATSDNTIKPVDGYGGPPTGPLNAVRHVWDDPTLRMYHFCKPNDKIMMVC